MKRLLFIAAALFTLPATSSLAQSSVLLLKSGSTVYLPSAANAAGLNGAQFRTRLFITNNNQGPIGLTVVAATSGGFLQTTLSRVNQAYVLENVLEDLFHYAGGAALSFTLTPDSIPDAVVAMRAEVYTDGPLGEYSTPLPLLTSESIVTGFSQSIGIRTDSGHRLNVGCSNFGQDAASIQAELFQGEGSASLYYFQLMPGQWMQTAVDPASLTSSQVPGVFNFGRTDAVSTTTTLPVFCFAVIVSNASNDGTLVPAVPDAGIINPSPY